MTTRGKRPDAVEMIDIPLEAATPVTQPILIDSEVFRLDMRRRLAELGSELDLVAYQLASSERLRDAAFAEADGLCEREIAAAREKCAGTRQDAQTMHDGRAVALRRRQDDVMGTARAIEAMLAPADPS